MAEILIVDDEIGIRELLSEILGDEGHEVVQAENAAQARLARKRARPDLVLLDIWMPDTDGVTLLREWVESGSLDMPVIMMSGHASVETAAQAIKMGAVGFLEKPIALQKLLQAVQRALKGSPRGPTGLTGATARSTPTARVQAMHDGRTARPGEAGSAAHDEDNGDNEDGPDAASGEHPLDWGNSRGGSPAVSGAFALDPRGRVEPRANATGRSDADPFVSSTTGPAAPASAVVAGGAPWLSALSTPAVDETSPRARLAQLSLDQPLREARDAFERLYFEHHLAREGGSMTRVAERTGLERTHLYRKLKQLGVEIGRAARREGQ